MIGIIIQQRLLLGFSCVLFVLGITFSLNIIGNPSMNLFSYIGAMLAAVGDKLLVKK